MPLLTGVCKAEKSEGNGWWDLGESEEVSRMTHHEIHSPESAPSSGLLFFNDTLLAEGGVSRGEAEGALFDNIPQIQ